MACFLSLDENSKIGERKRERERGKFTLSKRTTGDLSFLDWISLSSSWVEFTKESKNLRPTCPFLNDDGSRSKTRVLLFFFFFKNLLLDSEIKFFAKNVTENVIHLCKHVKIVLGREFFWLYTDNNLMQRGRKFYCSK